MTLVVLKSNDGDMFYLDLTEVIAHGTSNRRRYSCRLGLFSALRTYEAVMKPYEVFRSRLRQVYEHLLHRKSFLRNPVGKRRLPVRERHCIITQ
jgi:hypothetical protein